MAINIGMYLGELVFRDADEEVKKDDFFRCLVMSILLHDIGKIYKDNENHNRYSWAYADSRIVGLHTCVKSAILYHEFEVCGNLSSRMLMDEIPEDTLAKMDYFFREMKAYCEDTFGIILSKYEIFRKMDKDAYEFKMIPIYAPAILPKNYEKLFAPDAKMQLIRSILELSNYIAKEKDDDVKDKLLSNNTDEIGKNYSQFCAMRSIEFNGDVSFNTACFDQNRIQLQRELLEETFAHDHNVIQASPGFGKTLVGLMWFLQLKKRIVWVTPRNVFADGVFNSIMKELGKIGIDQIIKVGLYYGGNIINKNCEETELNKFDILVTNIDNIVNKTADKATTHMMLSMYTSNIVFDEYGDYVMQEGVFSAFIRLMHTRSRYTNSKTLLLSATQHNFDCLWGDNIVNYIPYKMINGDTKVKITYTPVEHGDDIPMNESTSNTIAICHTISDAQHVFKHLKKSFGNASLLHSRFTNKDKGELIKLVIEKYGNPNEASDTSEIGLLVGTNIIGSGINISCQKMYDFVVSPEATVQRCCGRCSRFGEHDEVEYHALATLNPNRLLLSREYDSGLRAKWQQALLELNGTTITKNELYELYFKFQKENRQAINKFLVNWFNLSSKSLSDIQLFVGPMTTKKGKKSKTLPDGVGYRGLNNGIFVTAQCTEDEDMWCDPIIVDFDLITNTASDRHEEQNINERKAAIRDGKYTGFYRVFDKKSVNKYLLGDYTTAELAKIAKKEKTPMPLFNFKYSLEYGLIHKIDL